MWDLIYSSNPLDLAPSHRSKRERGDDTISGYGRGEERGRKRDSGGDISPSFRLFEPPTFLVASPLPIPPPEPTVIYDSFSPSSAVIGRTNPRGCDIPLPEAKSVLVDRTWRTNDFHIFCTSCVCVVGVDTSPPIFCEILRISEEESEARSEEIVEQVDDVDERRERGR